MQNLLVNYRRTSRRTSVSLACAYLGKSIQSQQSFIDGIEAYMNINMGYFLFTMQGNAKEVSYNAPEQPHLQNLWTLNVIAFICKLQIKSAIENLRTEYNIPF